MQRSIKFQWRLHQHPEYATYTNSKLQEDHQTYVFAAISSS